MKALYSIATVLFIGLSLQAQNHVDALRFSQESLWGTARFVSMGGAFGALGGNASSASHNPAGIAIYSSGENSTTLSFINLETTTDYYGGDNNSLINRTGNVRLPNLNRISANIFAPEESGDWNRFNFALGYNTLHNFDQAIEISANQSSDSYIDYIVGQSQGKSYENLNTFSEQLAFDTYLTDTLGSTTNYVGAASGTYAKEQYFKSNRSGIINEIYLSFGTAYKNQLFLGVTIGFPTISYTEENHIRESNFEDPSSDLTSFDYRSTLSVDGSGINLKLGLIYKLENWLRYGFAIHTPTYFNINEEYWSDMHTVFDNGDNYDLESFYIGINDYDLRTPFKAINSLAIVINKRGLLSVDYEYLDYSMAQLSHEIYNYQNANDNIESRYSNSYNLKLGAEWRAHPQLSLRAGYSYYGSPYVGELNDASREYLTLGLGLNINQYFFDLAMVNMISEEDYMIYTNANPASIQTESSHMLFTMGMKF